MSRALSVHGLCRRLSTSPLAASVRITLAATLMLSLLPGPARSAGKGRWSPDENWRPTGSDKKYAAHMIVQPGDGNPYEARVLWFRGEVPEKFLGGQWGWTRGNDDCGAYPTSNFTPITVDTSGLDVFCAAHVLIDEKVAVVGGTDRQTGHFGDNKIRIYSPGTGTGAGSWSAPGSMAYWRWYPYVVGLRDSRILSVAGQMHTSHIGFGGYRNGSAPSSPNAHLVQRQQPVPSGTWDNAIFPVSSSAEWPGPRYGHSMQQMRGVQYFNSYLLFGGRDSVHTARKDVWRLFRYRNHLNADPQFMWQPATISGDGELLARSDHATVQTPHPGRPMVMFGGQDDDENPLNDVWRLIPNGAGLQWVRLNPSGTPPDARFGHAAIYDETMHATSGERLRRMIVFGGATTSDSSATDQDVWELRFHATDPASATWHKMTVVDLGSPKPGPRFWHSLTADSALLSTGSHTNAHVALMFGGKLGANTYSDSLWGLWILRDGTVGWQLRDAGSTEFAPGARARHSGVYDAHADHTSFGRFYVYGGETAGENGPVPADSYL